MDGQRLTEIIDKQDRPRYNLKDPIESNGTETLAFALLAGDPRVVAFIRERLPVFPLDNAIHVGESWCSGCHRWRAIELFTPDSTKASLTRCKCKDCRNADDREKRRREREGEREPKWYNGYRGLVGKGKRLMCPHCGAKRRQMKVGSTPAGSQRYRCGACNRNYTPEPKIHWITAAEGVESADKVPT